MVTPSIRHRPQVDQTHRFDALGLDDVDATNAIWLRPQLLLNGEQPPVPVPPVGLQLPYLLLVEEAQATLRVLSTVAAMRFSCSCRIVRIAWASRSPRSVS